MQILSSNIDSSVNFVEKELVGFIESRYVRRTGDYFIAYLSSQTGCNRGCKMCHLTATGQTQFTNCDLHDFVSQMQMVLKHYVTDTETAGNKATYAHINWMARGEPLANPTITETSTELLYRLGNMVRELGIRTKFNISTIMPVTLKKPLAECFPMITPTIYYSIYSVNPGFRNKWLPAAMKVEQALEMLAEYQQFSKKIIKFHGAFIKDENDMDKDINAMMAAISRYKIRGEFNIVRYNPFDSSQGQESPYILQICEMINQYMPCKIIPRVGEDVFASCGTFIK
jgi:23S rRNA (adenine2503-C2)-methyltransferase